MASTGIDFSKITPTNGAIQSLKELIFLASIDPETLGSQVNFMPGQEDNKKVGFIGSYGLLGTASTGCDPEYGSDAIKASEKTWDIKEFAIAESICYEDIKNALVKEAARRKTSVDDLTGTEYMDIISPLIEKAYKEALNRFAWFGDKEATDASMKIAGHAKYFTVSDGLWKRLFTGVTAGSIKRVNIAANAQTTVSGQKSSFAAKGVATGIVEEMIMSAPAVLRQQAGLRIYVTQAFADALTMDYRKNNVGSDLQWTALFDGIRTAQYAGVEIVAMPFWDAIIETELKNTTNANANQLPFRAILTVKENLLVGTESENETAELEIFFNQKDRKNYIYVKDTIGTLIAQDDLVVVAY